MRAFFPFGLVLLALYLYTATPAAGFDDSVFFALSCRGADIAHAPGYPLYALLCHPFALLLPFNPAFTAALFSAICAVLACHILAAIIYRLVNNRFAANGGAMLYGVSAGFWAQAIIPEVYALNVLLFLTALALALQPKLTAKTLILLVFLCALGVSNHWPLFILAALALPAALWQQRHELLMHLTRPKILAALIAVVALGLSPYLYLIWRTHHPQIFMGLPFAPDDWASFWQIVSREVHSASDEQGGHAIDKIGFLLDIGRGVLWKEFGLIGGVLAVAGFFWQWRRLPKSTATALTILFLTSTVLLIWLLGFAYSEVQSQVFAAYPLLSYSAACIWAAVAAAYSGRIGKYVLAAACVLAAGINFIPNNKHNDTLVEDITRAYFVSLPAGIWIPSPSQVKFAKYLQISENIRPDIIVLPPPNPFLYEMDFGGKQLYSPNSLHYEEEIQVLSDYARTNSVCYNTYVPFIGNWQSSEYLLFSCLGDENKAVLDSKITALFKELVNQPPHPHHRGRALTGRIIGDATRTMLHLQSKLRLPEEWKPLLLSLKETPYGFLSELEFFRAAEGLTLPMRRATKLAQMAETALPQINNQRQARMLSAMGDIYAAVSPRDDVSLAAAKEYHARAINITTNASTPVLQYSLKFYRRENLHAEEAALIAKYGPALFSQSRSVE